MPIDGIDLSVLDLVLETTQTTGTGTYSLDGAQSGFQGFAAVGDGETVPYHVRFGNDWEVGIGTITTGATDTLSRDQILASSNSDAAVNWASGVKDIRIDIPAAWFAKIKPTAIELQPETTSSTNLIILRDAAGNARWTFAVTGSPGAVFSNLRDSSGTSRIEFQASIGEIRCRDSGGTETIELAGGTGDITTSGNVAATGYVRGATAAGVAEAFRVGNDLSIWDNNISNGAELRGQASATDAKLRFGSGGPLLARSGSTLSIAGADILTGTVSQADIAANAVGQGELKTATGTVSVTGGNGSDLALPGGQYGFYPQVRHDTQATDEVAATIAGSGDFGDNTDTTRAGVIGTTFRANIRLVETADVSGVAEARQRYIDSSPPYDLGDGEIQGCIYLLIRTGSPVASYIAPTPPWIYNGPTDVRAVKVEKDGRKFRRVQKAAQLTKMLRDGAITLDEAKERATGPEFQGFDLELITNAIKNRDMDVIPHPFGSLEPGDQVVLLDPMDELVGRLLEAQEDGESIADLIVTRGIIRPDNEALPRQGPAGVMQVRIVS